MYACSLGAFKDDFGVKSAHDGDFNAGKDHKELAIMPKNFTFILRVM